ncbi:unnamed protein product [Notodromas monacha]|uniref:Egal-1 winged helix domain-containing protein n=1 Tax=Notodromas monacha TaxID=399045 RepID=A0A7R9BNK5_9CRUS|nr:unnamed protein product [Notodromas monacha]CAG0917274.1 unnamed protein product [Notodromas monacha]
MTMDEYEQPGDDVGYRDYDVVRNETLLFFLEHLMVRGGPRTLHDLSCQFGTRGFTRDMRLVAGGSQAGLRKFLASYPSLFTLHNDGRVSVTSFRNRKDLDRDDGSGNGGGGGGGGSGSGSGGGDLGAVPGEHRDAAAARYFGDKLRQYGAGAEVPVRCLLGHRSQAPPRVRHAAGQQLEEFKAFLGRFPEVFDMRCDGEVVVLLDPDSDLAPRTRRAAGDPLAAGFAATGAAGRVDPQAAHETCLLPRDDLITQQQQFERREQR